jgi:hypothetical protein
VDCEKSASIALPDPQRVTRRIANGAAAVGKFQETKCGEYSKENLDVYLSHRQYVHSLILTEIAACDRESWKSDWNSLENMFFTNSSNEEEFNSMQDRSNN